MDPKKNTSSLLGKRKGESETTALNAFQKAIEKALGISSNSSSVGAQVGANNGIVTGQSASKNLASNTTAGPSTTSSARKRVHSVEDQTSSNKRHRNDREDKTSSMVPVRKRVHSADYQTSSNKRPRNNKGDETSSKVPYMISRSPESQKNASCQAQKAAQQLKRKYKKLKRLTLDKQNIARPKEKEAMKVFQGAITKALGISTAIGASGTQIASTSVPSTSLAGNLQASSNTSSSVRKITSSFSEEKPTNKKKHREDKKAKKNRKISKKTKKSTKFRPSSSNRDKKKSKKTKTSARHRKISQPSSSSQQKADFKVFQEPIAKILGISTSGANTTPPTTKKKQSEDKKTKKNRKRSIKTKKTTKFRPSSSNGDKKRSKKTKTSARHTNEQPSSSSQQKADFKVFQNAIAKALGISTSGANTSVVTSQTSAPPTMTVAKYNSTITSTSYFKMKKDGLEYQKNNTGNGKESQSSSSSQQQASAYKVFQDAIAKALGISTSAANTSVVTCKTSVPPTMTVAKDTYNIPSGTLAMKKGGFAQHTGNNTRDIGGIVLPATNTGIMPNISSSIAQKGSLAQQQQHSFMKLHQCTLQNNAMVPQNPSTTTRGIYEYIASSDREHATRAHQQQMFIQQQMKHLRESPYSVQENSPLFKNPIPETKKRKFDTNLADVALWNPKRFRLQLGKRPKVHPKALERKPEAQKIQGKEDCASDIFPPSSVFMARLRERAPKMTIKDTLLMIKSQQSEK